MEEFVNYIIGRPMNPETLKMLRSITVISNMNGARLDPVQVGMALIDNRQVTFIFYFKEIPREIGEYFASSGDRMFYFNLQSCHFHYSFSAKSILYIEECKEDHSGYVWRW